MLGPLLLAVLYGGLLARAGDMQYGLNPQLITLMVGIGIVLSFLTLPLWYLGFALI